MIDNNEIVGPDLTKAEPIADVIARLSLLRKGYASAFLRTCEETGIDVMLLFDADGSEHVMMGTRADGQETERLARIDALAAQMKRGETRRPAVIRMLKVSCRPHARRSEVRHG